MTKTATSETASDLLVAMYLIMRHSPQLITDDPTKHLDNLMMFGTSVLIQAKAKPGGLTLGGSKEDD